tara:strand:+ start:8719 stop:8922 length:204 start_codon:yes stop_codon:yes gene_type:complete
MRESQLKLLCITYEKVGLLEASFALTRSPIVKLHRDNARLEAELLFEKALHKTTKEAYDTVVTGQSI